MGGVGFTPRWVCPEASVPSLWRRGRRGLCRHAQLLSLLGLRTEGADICGGKAGGGFCHSFIHALNSHSLPQSVSHSLSQTFTPQSDIHPITQSFTPSVSRSSPQSVVHSLSQSVTPQSVFCSLSHSPPQSVIHSSVSCLLLSQSFTPSVSHSRLTHSVTPQSVSHPLTQAFTP